MKAIALATFLIFGLAGSTAAVDAVGEMPPGDSAYDWSGFYVGGVIGYVPSGRIYHEFEPGGLPSNTFDYDLEPDGMFGGLYLGYNHQFTNGIVLGVEADLALGDIEASGFTIGDPEYSSTTEIDWTGSVRLRAGYAMDRFLPFVTGGVALGHFRFEERESGLFYSAAEGHLVGWTVGAGGEYALTERWLLRGEYRYAEYDDEHFVADPEDEQFASRISTHDFRVGVAYKF